MNLYLLRHLPTPWNLEGRLQGNRDISIIRPLSPDSTAKVEQNKIVLGKIRFDAVYVSEKKRAQETAVEYGYTNAIASPLVNELDFGPFEGVLKQEAIQKMGDDFVKNPFKTVLGRNYQDLERNIRSFLQLNQTKSNVLVFGHGTFIRGMKCFVETGDIASLNSFPLPNNEIVALKVN